MAMQLFGDDFFVPFFANHYHQPHQRRGGRGCRAGAEVARPTLIDVQESAKTFQISADLPGVDKSDIRLHVEGDVLSLAVERAAEKQEESADPETGLKLHRSERAAAFMSRNLKLPETADLSKIHARYQDGVLKLDIPKHEEEMPRSRSIPIE